MTSDLKELNEVTFENTTPENLSRLALDLQEITKQLKRKPLNEMTLFSYQQELIFRICQSKDALHLIAIYFKVIPANFNSSAFAIFEFNHGIVAAFDIGKNSEVKEKSQKMADFLNSLISS